MPEILKRMESVRKFRMSSVRKQTIEKANTPSLFGEIRDFGDNYLVVPRVSSENRKYIPIGFFDKKSIVSDTCMAIPNCQEYHFGILSSEMHMTWVRNVCGRLKSDFRYSKDIVYNNFPWPHDLPKQRIQGVEKLARQVLKVRERYPDSSLADLYDPLTMPSDLVHAHQELDKFVDSCYRPLPFSSEAKRMEFLFELYEKYTADLFTQEKVKRTKKKINQV